MVHLAHHILTSTQNFASVTTDLMMLQVGSVVF